MTTAYSREWFDERFTTYLPQTQETVPAEVPLDIRRCSELICQVFGIQGLCDPMYIANVVAFELNRGDGQGNFQQGSCSEDTFCEKLSTLEKKLSFAYGTCIEQAKLGAARRQESLPALSALLKQTLLLTPKKLHPVESQLVEAVKALASLSMNKEIPAPLAASFEALSTIAQDTVQAYLAHERDRWINVKEALPHAFRDVRVRRADGSVTIGRVNSAKTWEYVRFKADVSRGSAVPMPWLDAVEWLDDELERPVFARPTKKALGSKLLALVRAFQAKFDKLPEHDKRLLASLAKQVSEAEARIPDLLSFGKPHWAQGKRGLMPYLPVLVEDKENRRLVARLNDAGLWELASYQATKSQYMSNDIVRWYCDDVSAS